MIKILVVEDMHVVRAGLVALLAGEFGIEVAGQAADAAEALTVAERCAPDVAVLDIDLPGMDGLGLARELAVRAPRCRMLMLTALDRPGHVRRALDAGASGYLLKSVTPQRLAEAVRTVAVGGRVIEPRSLADASGAVSPLTAREAETLRLAADGADSRAIAAELFLGVGTVRNRLASTTGKLGARTLVDAIRIAERHGWI
ncbi:response regulator transcription factor [Streptomyces scopuliridis]|uniref:Response regulator transcription factor n=1 Tax=Streptomyces scopuliridis TaxID=452529 RepID=A0ACD4ZFZ6_9ACTN|nr:response regulator transcription factor [Streptomyces scopuliridis]WSB32494.1 response regulator transcription factor [Streptomyces scopuliridis]WSB96741.1 response regulator transcription factor [Streptomyces scopuliridis]WSC09556.1 response regulator transcription factor [Streptomyces scopuliridis]